MKWSEQQKVVEVGCCSRVLDQRQPGQAPDGSLWRLGTTKARLRARVAGYKEQGTRNGL